MNTLPPPSLSAHLALVGPDVVLLDVAKDAYFCLPGAAVAWRRLQAGEASEDAEALARALAGGGYLGAGGPRETRRPRPAAGLPPGAPSLRAVDLWRLLRAWLDSLRHYRRRRFDHLLGFATADRPPAPRPHGELILAAQRFERLVIWLPASGKCLLRSFLLLRFLRHSGCTADWVFGVAVWPFKAHCWLEAGGVALDDAPERLVGYTPILAA